MKIESGIPIPLKLGRGTRRRQILDCLRQLKKYQSTPDLIHSHLEQQSVLEAARAHGIKVVTRKMEKGGWRVWRVA